MFDFKNDYALTLEENKWIDENKYDVVDIAVLNDIPVLSDEGEGIVYDYFDYSVIIAERQYGDACFSFGTSSFPW